jgi:hypothetical protein
MSSAVALVPSPGKKKLYVGKSDQLHSVTDHDDDG